jgi:hypothetical protein
MDQEALRIVLRYDGLDADKHAIDLNQLGQSIQGAAKLLGSAGHIAVTGQFAKQQQALSVRVLAGPAQANCYEFAALLMTIGPAGPLIFPSMRDAAYAAMKKAVTGVVNYTLAKIGGRRSEAEIAADVAKTALAEMGHTSRTVVEAMERAVSSLRPAARAFVAPVGQSCSLAQIGTSTDGALSIDKLTRDVIDAPEPMEIGPVASYEILISELDLKNRSCKFSLHDQDDPDNRFNGEITDPLIDTPDNPYSRAFNQQAWLAVSAKPRLRDGEVERLYISDTAIFRSLPAPT